MRRRLADSHKGGIDERRRRCKTKGAKRLCPGKSMLGRVLSRCIGQEEAQRKLKEVHEKTCGSDGKVNLYCRL